MDRQLLGTILLSRGLITEEELTAALAAQKRSGALLGVLLTTAGKITEEELAACLKEQARQAIL